MVIVMAAIFRHNREEQPERRANIAGGKRPVSHDRGAAPRDVGIKGGTMTTESVVMRASSGTVRWVRGEHRKPR